MRTVAIVGRPNVGKSALFNRLARRRISIVHDQPGVTRDRIFTECRWDDEPFTLIDTGGIGSDVDTSFAEQVDAEVTVAMETADLILFMVDGQAGLTPVDQTLAKRLRKVDKPILLVVNKVDHPKHEEFDIDFARLGFKDTLCISAEHNRGITDLVEKIQRRIREAVGRYIAEMKPDEKHPLLSRRARGFDYTGSWSSRLKDCGFHTNHIHPEGWISSCYYVALPKAVEDTEGRQGWIKFGEPAMEVDLKDPIRRAIQPRAGRLVLFPSYMWHGTVPFRDTQPRTTIAFDAIPTS